MSLFSVIVSMKYPRTRLSIYWHLLNAVNHLYLKSVILTYYLYPPSCSKRKVRKKQKPKWKIIIKWRLCMPIIVKKFLARLIYSIHPIASLSLITYIRIPITIPFMILLSQNKNRWKSRKCTLAYSNITKFKYLNKKLIGHSKWTKGHLKIKWLSPSYKKVAYIKLGKNLQDSSRFPTNGFRHRF
jgi:hypothetical protein